MDLFEGPFDIHFKSEQDCLSEHFPNGYYFSMENGLTSVYADDKLVAVYNTDCIRAIERTEG